jgi:hypothetical protein
MMHVLHPNVNGPSFGEMSRFNWNTNVTQVVEREFLTPGGDFFAHLFSNGPVGAGQVVEIRAGTASQDGSITNDMEIESASRFRYSIRSVAFRIAP